MADRYAIFPRLAELEAIYPDVAKQLNKDLIDGVILCFEIDDPIQSFYPHGLYSNKWDAVNLIKSKIDKILDAK